ncbi:UNVERIFIED_ORG: hypothetical protein EDC92_11848 [Dietzia maris]
MSLALTVRPVTSPRIRSSGRRSPHRRPAGYFAVNPASTGIVTPVTWRPDSSTR